MKRRAKLLANSSINKQLSSGAAAAPAKKAKVEATKITETVVKEKSRPPP